jgi:hypothetical protein
MLRELMQDNKAMAAAMRRWHGVAEKHADAATAGLLETFIDETEKRTWFLFEASGTTDRVWELTVNSLIRGLHPPQELHGRAASLILPAPQLGGGRWLGRPARCWWLGGLADEFQQARASVGAIPDLAAEARRADEDDTVGRHASPGELVEPLTYRIRQ